MEHVPNQLEPQNSSAAAPQGTQPGAAPSALPGGQQNPSTPASQVASQGTPQAAASPGTNADPGAAAQTFAPVVSVDRVKLSLRRVKDPDLQINIIDLGLVYGIRVDGNVVSVDLTLTSPGCPSGDEISGDAERELLTIPGVEDVKINLVWAPFWTPDKIEPRVRAYLGI
jgi:metal-sulfur cluster biosynthetic enzyme